MIQKNFFKIIFLSLLIVGCTATPPQQPDNICSIFKEKNSWYKAAIRTEKRWKLPPYVLMSFVFQESRPLNLSSLTNLDSIASRTIGFTSGDKLSLLVSKAKSS